MTFNFTEESIVWQEVPGEISLAYLVSGCPLRCPGCHSSHSWNPSRGQLLTTDHLLKQLHRYASLVTCVLFMGGDWRPDALKPLLICATQQGLKTCLYSGHDQVPACLLPHLTYLKTGPWVKELGGLGSQGTNQRFIEVTSGKNLNHLFEGKTHAEIN